jgi:hypothetical protein
LSCRRYLCGLFAVLLALAVQLATRADVPRPNPMAQLAGVEILCHGASDAGGAPAKVPVHPGDCLACPFCVAGSPTIPVIPSPPDLALPRVTLAQRPELPPPPRAPPFRLWSPTQPRAPPAVS